MTEEQRTLHVLNRLTFGPRPGDMDAVRRAGLERWVGMQLHPESIAENPVLEKKLEPLETLRLDTAAILKDYPVTRIHIQRPPSLDKLLSPDQLQMLKRGTAEEQASVLNALDGTKRREVLIAAGPGIFRTLELRNEADAAQQDDLEAQMKEMRQMMPPVIDLLNDPELRTATSGTYEEKKDLFESMEPAKRQLVAAAMAQQMLIGFPELRRQGSLRHAPQRLVTGDMREGKVLRAIYSTRQLEEVLVDFWFNHFNVDEAKTHVRPLVVSFERDAIRPHVLGTFRDLLLATARHPAMLYYLDNFESAASDRLPGGLPGVTVDRKAKRARGLNENYGRELMELHTLGVKGGYTQADVIAVARCFTGWTVQEPQTNPAFLFAPFLHDMGEKVVLGHKIAAGGGEQDGLQVIEILARHPSTAKFISRKLAQRFVSDDPPGVLVDRMAQVFTRTQGDLRAVLGSLFHSPEFFADGARGAKVKSPLEMVVSAVRAVDADVTDSYLLAQRIADLGESLYGKVEPSGYANTGEGWLSTANLLGRISFAAELMKGSLPGVRVNEEGVRGRTTRK